MYSLVKAVPAPGGEDPGLCFKLLQAGWSLQYAKQAVFRHHYRSGLFDFARTFYRYGRGCRAQTDAFALGLGEGEPPTIGFGGVEPSFVATH